MYVCVYVLPFFWFLLSSGGQAAAGLHRHLHLRGAVLVQDLHAVRAADEPDLPGPQPAAQEARAGPARDHCRPGAAGCPAPAPRHIPLRLPAVLLGGRLGCHSCSWVFGCMCVYCMYVCCMYVHMNVSCMYV